MPSLQNSLCGHVGRGEHELQPLSRKPPGTQKAEGYARERRGEEREMEAVYSPS